MVNVLSHGMNMNSSDNNYNGDGSDGEKGARLSNEVINGYESRCMINCRMSSTIFRSLLRVLETRYNLQSPTNISSHEILGISLHMLSVGAKVSQCREKFQ
ncbi:hypothetical protein Gohar_009990, partial [Gossypium harknessii]|nr:hypothetical protein [Gossypium harknessii]